MRTNKRSQILLHRFNLVHTLICIYHSNKDTKKFNRAFDIRRKVEIKLLKSMGCSDYAAEFGFFHWY